jgi:hypothetical protein
MLRWYPYVPVGGELAVNCAILSYDGTVYFGFSGDVHAAPDLRRLEEFLKVSFAELRNAVSPRQEKLQKKSARPKKVRVKTQITSKPAPVAVSVPLPIPSTVPSPAASVRAPEPTAEEGKALTQRIA